MINDEIIKSLERFGIVLDVIDSRADEIVAEKELFIKATDLVNRVSEPKNASLIIAKMCVSIGKRLVDLYTKQMDDVDKAILHVQELRKIPEVTKDMEGKTEDLIRVSSEYRQNRSLVTSLLKHMEVEIKDHEKKGEG